jgi:voltage-gated potassium channel
MVFDVIAVLPFWLGFFVTPEYLAAVRSMRILRLLKFYRASPVAHLVMENLIYQWKKLRLVTGFVTIVVLFSGTVMHHLEAVAQPETFGSLWSSIWWAVVTMTTVGYGDMSPVTHAGQAVTMLLMLTSIGIVGALISIVGTAFDVEPESEL